ncbi:MAG: hypothetical protein J5875_03130 [Paludibacteraceae bacterium]|nr:hypothetical protein [Paludibacteraceae bacterium]
MNRKHKTYGHFFMMVIALVLAAVGTSAVYQIARNRPPIAYGNLSPEAIARFKKQMSKSGEKGALFTIDQLNLAQWDNENDLGAQDTAGWSKIEDNNFIIYYKDDMQGVWKQKAKITLKLVNEAIPQMKEIFGSYTYPKDINDRKLPIYLPPTRSQYGQTINLLRNEPVDAESSLGITIYKVSQSGFLPLGIVIRNDVFDADNFQNSLVVVATHELTHYVYGSLFQFSDKLIPKNWVTEGIADYTAGRSPQVQGSDSINFINNYCDLLNDFPIEHGNFLDNQYWAGESFFDFVEEKYGKETVSKFIQTTYTTPIDSVILAVFPNSNNIHKEWVEAISKNAEPQSSISANN